MVLFIVSALFGKVMEDTGAARAIAFWIVEKLGEKYAILGMLFAGAILSYGGVASLVIAFTLYPIALNLFKQADLPRYLIPAVIAAGCWTFACAHLPGTPQVLNVVPIPYLGTTTMAAPVVGLVVGTITCIAICFYMLYVSKRARRLGHRFIVDDHVTKILSNADTKAPVNPYLAFLPIVLVLIVLNVIKINVNAAMFCGVVLCVVLFFKNLKGVSYESILNTAVGNSAMALITTGGIVGFGTVVQASPAYNSLLNTALSIGGSPLVSFGVTTTLIAGACGSGIGGVGVALSSIGKQYLAMGINPEILHRVATSAGVGLDSLPHNGAVTTLTSMTDLTHKECYIHIFITTVLITTIALCIAIAMGTAMYL
jgi:H+/gluconate symporter-like permease